MSGEQGTKAWTSRPEGKVGTVVGILLIGGAAVGALYFWGIILPWLIMMMANTLTLMALCAGFAAVCWVLFDKRWRNLAWYAYKSLMRALTSAFIDLDPIGIMKSYVASLKDKLAEIDKSLGLLEGQRRSLHQQIDKNEHDRTHCLELMKVAQAQHRQDVIALQGRQAERLAGSNVSLQTLLTNMDKLAAFLGKMRERSDIMIQDIQGEVDVRTRERASLLAGYSAFSKAKSIMQGSGDEREMYDMTTEKLIADYSDKMGEIDQFMNVSKGILATGDLEDGVAINNALAALDTWSNKTGAAPVNGADVHLRVQPVPPTTDFSDFFEDSTSTSTKADPSRR
jgi:hypothetical protein